MCVYTTRFLTDAYLKTLPPVSFNKQMMSFTAAEDRVARFVAAVCVCEDPTARSLIVSAHTQRRGNCYSNVSQGGGE